MPRVSKLAWTVLALAVISWPQQSKACSVADCNSQRVEMEANFRVILKLGRTGLHGGKVEIIALATGRLAVAELTESSGQAVVKKLPPGDYHIRVSYLGVTATEYCFHVRAQSSASAISTLRVRWAGYGVAVRAVTGSLEEWRPGNGVTLLRGKDGALLAGKGGNPILNFDRGVAAPIEGAITSLENALTREVLRSQSDDKGLFRFGVVPDGIYVLHIEGGKTARAYEPADMIIPVDHTATRDFVVLTLQEACGFTTFSPQWR